MYKVYSKVVNPNVKVIIHILSLVLKYGYQIGTGHHIGPCFVQGLESFHFKC